MADPSVVVSIESFVSLVDNDFSGAVAEVRKKKPLEFCLGEFGVVILEWKIKGFIFRPN